MTKLSRNTEGFKEEQSTWWMQINETQWDLWGFCPEVFFVGSMAIFPGWVAVRLICKPEMFLCKVFNPATSQVKDLIVSLGAAVSIISPSKCEAIRWPGTLRVSHSSGHDVLVTALSRLGSKCIACQWGATAAVVPPIWLPTHAFSNQMANRNISSF